MASEVKTNKISPATGTAFTLGDSGDTFTIPSGVTLTNNGTASGFGGTNTPAFYANRTSSQSITTGTWTKVQFDNEVYDTGSAYDPTTNYRFTVPSGEGGKYFISGQSRLLGVYLSWGQLGIYKNGTIIAQNGGQYGTNDYRYPLNVSRVLELSAGDYIEIYAYMTGSTLTVEGDASSDYTAFFGFKLVE